MIGQLPDPKTIVDSIADGAVELLETGSRVVAKSGAIIQGYGATLQACAEDIKRRTPDDPSVFVDAAIKAAGSTVKAMVGGAEAIISGIDETAKGVKSQIDRVIR